MNAVAYVRCSSERQAEKDSSIPAQRAEIERRAAGDGAAVVRWFADDGISGKNIEDRPGIQALLSFVSEQKGAIQRLYVYDSRRLARNREDAFVIRKALARAKCRIVALTQPSVEDEVTNVLLESLWDGIAEMERHTLSRHIRRGQRQALADGWWPYPRAPYGYRRVPEANGRGAQRWKLEIEPEAAAVVRRVAALYLEGWGYTLIASVLTRNGVTPPGARYNASSPSVEWSEDHVREILSNPAYTGAGVWNERGRPEGEIVNERHHEPILDAETWASVRRVAAERHRDATRLGSLNTAKSALGVFRPWMRCGACGGAMILNYGGTPANRIAYYQCLTRSKNRERCVGVTARVAETDAALSETIEREVVTIEQIREVVADTLAHLNDNGERELAERRSMIEAALRDAGAELDRLTRAIQAGVLEAEDARAYTDPVRKRRDALRGELAELPSPRPLPKLEEIDLEQFRAGLLEALRGQDIRERRKALDAVIDEIVLEPGRIRLRYAWKDRSGSHTGREGLGPSPPP